jgi:hypothetical protein
MVVRKSGRALSACSLHWAVVFHTGRRVYPADVALLFASMGRRAAKSHIPDSKSVAAERCSRMRPCDKLLAETPLKTLAGTIYARWICDRHIRSLKENSADYFEGR